MEREKEQAWHQLVCNDVSPLSLSLSFGLWAFGHGCYCYWYILVVLVAGCAFMCMWPDGGMRRRRRRSYSLYICRDVLQLLLTGYANCQLNYCTLYSFELESTHGKAVLFSVAFHVVDTEGTGEVGRIVLVLVKAVIYIADFDTVIKMIIEKKNLAVDYLKS